MNLEHNASVEAVAALLAVQSALEPLKKNKLNPYHKSKYVDLAKIMTEVLPVLNEHGFLLVQKVECDGIDRVVNTLVTAFIYKDGTVFIGGDCVLPVPENPTAQNVGSAITYMKRYCLCAALGIVAEDDDDGHAATYSRNDDTAPKEVKTNQNVNEEIEL